MSGEFYSRPRSPAPGVAKYLRRGKNTIILEAYGPQLNYTRLSMRHKGGLSRSMDLNVIALKTLRTHIDKRLDELGQHTCRCGLHSPEGTT